VPTKKAEATVAPLFSSFHAEKLSEEWTVKSRGRQAVATPHSTPKKTEQQCESEWRIVKLTFTMCLALTY
jgi:hypothetical protein